MAWTIQDLEKDLKRLKELYNQETNPTIKEELAYDIYCVETMLTGFCTDRVVSAVKRGEFFVCQDYIWRYRSELPHIRDFIEKTDDYIKKVNFGKPKFDYSAEDMYELSREFYKSVGGKFYKAYQEFDKEKENRVNLFPMHPADSTTYTIPALNKYYMNIGTGKDDRDTIGAFIHEAGHVATFKLNNKRYHSLQIFTEIESLFFEMLGEEFLADKTKDEYFMNLSRHRLYEYNCSGNVMDIFGIAYNTVMDNITDLDDPNKVFLEVCYNEGMRKTQPVNIDDNMKYVFSYICAIELVEIYKEDPDKALFLLENIISTDNTISEYERIVRNVTPNEHMKEYAKTLTKKRTTS